MTTPTTKELMRLRKVHLMAPLIARYLVDTGIGITTAALDRIESTWGDQEWEVVTDHVNDEHRPIPAVGLPSVESRALIVAELRACVAEPPRVRRVARRLATSADRFRDAAKDDIDFKQRTRRRST